jgi:hypothetical protein
MSWLKEDRVVWRLTCNTCGSRIEMPAPVVPADWQTREVGPAGSARHACPRCAVSTAQESR